MVIKWNIFSINERRKAHIQIEKKYRQKNEYKINKLSINSMKMKWRKKKNRIDLFDKV